MIESHGRVIRCQGSAILVETATEGGCSSCLSATQGSCGTGKLTQVLGRSASQIWLQNSLKLRQGDGVVVGMEEKGLLWGALLQYILPLVMLMIFGIFGESLAGEGAAVILGTIGLFCGLLVSRHLQRSSLLLRLMRAVALRRDL